ncbi:alanine racemase [Marininema mesophilum]|uniref:Alanine racemase n=1 Tax=Marininema mesophilum TaxID=1048340 RepID=A0A1H3AWL5_9BACL|nr:alanine racemase [Marininema mesophilum]SDX33504.1 alanine racemase [Marininema mesophilum]
MANDPYYRDTVAEIDLDAIAHNVKQFKRRLMPKVRLMVAVKADAYGHGAFPVSEAALEAGATDLAVAFLDEAIALRKAGITAPILVFGRIPERGIAEALRQQVTFTVFDVQALRSISHIAMEQGVRARVHLKMDTGMGRLGVWGDGIILLAEEAATLPGIELEGLYTHFATADEKDKSYTRQQYGRLVEVNEKLHQRGIHIPLIHCANSAAAIDLPELMQGMIRVGISLYGYYPSTEVDQTAVELRPALTLKTRVVQVKKSEPGTGISYGRTHIPKEGEWVATLPIGYADGFSRLLSNRGFALVRGQRVPIIGRVCMDQTMIDVTSVMPIKPGEEVVLYGTQAGETIHVDEIASMMGTISYEVTCLLGQRIPRCYIRKGSKVSFSNPLLIE